MSVRIWGGGRAPDALSNLVLYFFPNKQRKPLGATPSSQAPGPHQLAYSHSDLGLLVVILSSWVRTLRLREARQEVEKCLDPHFPASLRPPSGLQLNSCLGHQNHRCCPGVRRGCDSAPSEHHARARKGLVGKRPSWAFPRVDLPHCSVQASRLRPWLSSSSHSPQEEELGGRSQGALCLRGPSSFPERGEFTASGNGSEPRASTCFLPLDLAFRLGVHLPAMLQPNQRLRASGDGADLPMASCGSP